MFQPLFLPSSHVLTPTWIPFRVDPFPIMPQPLVFIPKIMAEPFSCDLAVVIKAINSYVSHTLMSDLGYNGWNMKHYVSAITNITRISTTLVHFTMMIDMITSILLQWFNTWLLQLWSQPVNEAFVSLQHGLCRRLPIYQHLFFNFLFCFVLSLNPSLFKHHHIVSPCQPKEVFIVV